jgi:hypothetical protein
MKTTASVLVLLAAKVLAQDVPVYLPKEDPNRFSAGPMFLFNTKLYYSASPSGMSGVNPGPAVRGGSHTYDDGFVGVDSTGNNAPPGATSFWGYNNASQWVDFDPLAGVAADGFRDSIAMNASIVNGSTGYAPGGDVGAQVGLELGYSRVLGHSDRATWGAEILLGFLDLDQSSSAPGSLGITTLTDVYSLTVNGILVTPPGAPYSGPQDAQPGSPLLDDSPQRQPPLNATGMVAGSRSFDANIYTLRLGGFYDYAVTKKFNLGLNAGLALIFVNGEFSFNEIISFAGPTGPTTLVQAGSNREFCTLAGGYVGVRASYDLDPHWRLFGTANYLSTTSYEQTAGGVRSLTLEFKNTFLLSVGVGYAF